MKALKLTKLTLLSFMFLFYGFLNSSTAQIEVEKPPKAMNLTQVTTSIVYPEAALQAGIRGKVRVKILVDTDGRVIKIGTYRAISKNNQCEC